MATLVLQAAGQAVGGLLGPVGAIVGRAGGAIAGNLVDQQLFGESRTRSVGRIDDLSIQTASEGNPIPLVYGRMRLAGTVIWASALQEHVDTRSTGGKGGGPKVRQYTYTASFAVGICEGPVARIGRIWADGELLDSAGLVVRTYLGNEDQAADPLIEAAEGVAPAFRGLTYVVFEQLSVGPYGNRLPQLTFEVIRPVGPLETQVRAVTMIPGASEFGYHPDLVKRQVGPGEAAAENRHTTVAASDFEASLDELVALCPNLERIALVVSWFGDDLRAGSCTLRPKVEGRDRATTLGWGVSGEDRETAALVSMDEDGRPYYGGTPSDASVFAAIEAIKSRGLKVVFYPFVLMDVPPGNGLGDPYGGLEQAAFPWRGRITVSPAPGLAGSPDGSSAATAEISALVGSAVPGDFSGSGSSVVYGGGEWSLRRMVLHYARLCAQAGGVDAFLVGSELRGLTRVRGTDGYPFVEALSKLVDDVRSVVGPSTQISYAADWSEYFGHQVGPDEFRFHLDPLWANANVDFVGIDNYWPLSDWRDGSHLDAEIAPDVYDHDYLLGNVRGGEGYDWYYASAADRLAQVRTPIPDENWRYRYKDVAAWWGNVHRDVVGGQEVASATGWVPKSKPVWFTEVGCPAIDRGSNQPNVFYDPKSTESAFPYFSGGGRDDAMQRAHLGAILSAWDGVALPLGEAGNPISSVYGGRMVDPATVHVWTWDARPWPAFPHRTDVWSDGANWERGHWLTGRLGAAPVADVVRALFLQWGLEPPAVRGVHTVLDGFVVGGPVSLRGALEPLLGAVSALLADTGDALEVFGLDRPSVARFGEGDLVEIDARTPLLTEVREEAGDLPVEVRLRYYDSGRSFQTASARYRPSEGSARQVDTISVPASMNDGLAAQLAELALAVRLAGRTTARFALPPSDMAIVPGDVLTLSLDGFERDLIVEEVEDLGPRLVVARSIDRAAYTTAPAVSSGDPPLVPPTLAPPVAFGLNLPLIDDGAAEHAPFLASFARPFPDPMGVWQAVPGGSFQLLRTVEREAAVGELVSPAAPGFAGRWDEGAALDVRLYNAALAAAERADVLGGQNALAVQAADGRWEILQFRSAELIGEGTYRLTGLLRGQRGTEDAAALGAAIGAPVSVLDGSLAVMPIDRGEVGLTRTYRVGALADGPVGLDTTTFDFVGTGRGLAPFAPAHGSARFVPSDGSLLVSWIRRTRIGGEVWDGTDVPLGESDERYRLEFLSGARVVRSVETTAPSYAYAPADQVADFGGLPDPLVIRVAQIAPGFGAGVPYQVSLNVQYP